VGPDGGRVESHGHRRSPGRYGRGVQLARSDGGRLFSQAGSRGAGRRHRVAQLPEQLFVRHAIAVPPERHDPITLVAVPQSQRYESSDAGRERHHRADAAGEPHAHAECGQGDSPVHRPTAFGLRRADGGGRIPECERRHRAGEILRATVDRSSEQYAVGTSPDLGEPSRVGRRPDAGRQCLAFGNSVGRQENSDRGGRHVGRDLGRRRSPPGVLPLAARCHRRSCGERVPDKRLSGARVARRSSGEPTTGKPSCGEPAMEKRSCGERKAATIQVATPSCGAAEERLWTLDTH
jgi:hypothetical protein